MRVHAIRTGTVCVHRRQRSGEGKGIVRFAKTLLDSEWTEPLPIYAWVVEHPEGLLVVDTGETSRVSEPGYFPRWHPYYRWAVELEVSGAEEIGPRMQALGLDPGDVRWVVMTHLHTDHAGGLHHFSEAEILVSSVEYDDARGVMGKVRGYLPHRWPRWFEPTLLHPEALEGRSDRPFETGYSVTRAGDVRVAPTPGHTAGHVSVIVEEEDRTLFLAGDATYTQENLLKGVVDGVSSMGGGEAVATATIERIRRHAEARPTVYLPSHDPDAARRLNERQVVDVSGRSDGEGPGDRIVESLDFDPHGP